MLEQNLDNMITSVEQQLTLVKLKLKATKKELKQLRSTYSDVTYLDMEKIESAEKKLIMEISDLDTRIYKLNKVLYRLKVCEKILNSKE